MKEASLVHKPLSAVVRELSKRYGMSTRFLRQRWYALKKKGEATIVDDDTPLVDSYEENNLRVDPPDGWEVVPVHLRKGRAKELQNVMKDEVVIDEDEDSDENDSVGEGMKNVMETNMENDRSNENNSDGEKKW